jgi:hypothetical protein
MTIWEPSDAAVALTAAGFKGATELTPQALRAVCKELFGVLGGSSVLALNRGGNSVSYVRTVTDLEEAKTLYEKLYQHPLNDFHSWELMEASFDPKYSTPHFLVAPQTHLPCQLTAAADHPTLEWFGTSFLCELRELPGPLDEVQALINAVNADYGMGDKRNDLDNISYPRVPEGCAPSIMTPYWLPVRSHSDWVSSLHKKRRWELRQAYKKLSVRIEKEVPDLLSLVDKGIQLLNTSLEERESTCFYIECPADRSILERVLNWYNERGKLDAITAYDEQGAVLGVAFGALDSRSRVYHWIFSGSLNCKGFYVSRFLISEVVKAAVTSGALLVNGMSGSLWFNDSKALMGFSPKLTWSPFTSQVGFGVSPG